MDLSSLSVPQLRDLLQEIPQEIKRREVVEKNEILNEVRAFAKARGYNIEDLMGKDSKAKSGPATGGKVKVKYRHPSDATLEWTGRGRTPKWVQAWVESGSTLDALLV